MILAVPKSIINIRDEVSRRLKKVKKIQLNLILKIFRNYIKHTTSIIKSLVPIILKIP